MTLIGLMGIKGSGKTTAAQYIVKKYGFVEKSFAECLKKACQELFLLTDEQVFGTQEQKETPDSRWFNCTPRKILQFVGTDLLRNNLDKIMPELGKNIFIHHFHLWYQKELAKNPNLNVIISDVRFENEINFIQNLGGYVIKINRPDLLLNDLHPSEIELQNITSYDLVIENNATIDDLYEKILCATTSILFNNDNERLTQIKYNKYLRERESIKETAEYIRDKNYPFGFNR